MNCQILNTILLLISSKSEILPLNWVQGTLFRTWDSALSSNGSLFILFLSPSKYLRMVLKKHKESIHIYVVDHSDLFLSDVMHEYLNLNIDVLFSFFISLKTGIAERNFSTIALGKEYKCSLYWTRNKRTLPWLVYPSFIIMVAFCFVSLTCPLVNELILLKNSSKKI